MTANNMHLHPMLCRGKTFEWGERTYIMGVVNATPDSFSGDGLDADVGAMVELALEMEAAGADIIDVGGESTRRYNDRPGAEAVELEEELRRAGPVVERLAREVRVPVSIDTYKAQVAERCLALGASMINNIWGTSNDPDMLRVAASHGVPYVLMHNRVGHSYTDMVPEMVEELRRSVEEAVQAGVRRENIIVDPGIGFGKMADQCLELETRIGEFRVLGLPILVGPSRKSHLGLVLGGLPPDDRLEGTAAAVALCIAGGADIVRVHDVRQMVRVAQVTDAIVRGWRPESWQR